jgi:hypothetical protein
VADEVAAILDPLFDHVPGLVENGVHSFANILDILPGGIKHRLGVI